MLAAVVVTVGAVAAGQRALVAWGVALICVAGASMAWARHAWRGVEVEAAFRPARVFAGEPFTLIVRLSNRKRLPVPIVRLTIWLRPGLLVADGVQGSTARGHRRQVSLPASSDTVISLPVVAAHRGEYALERIAVELADPFDLAPMTRDVRSECEVLVMPEPRIHVPIEVIRRLPFGVPSRAPRIFEERERFAGVRPYEPGDPLNRIHWRLTGHSGVLQTKLFEPTRSADVELILDLALGEPFWDSVYPDIAEDTIGWASFIARRAVEGGWRIGLIANTHLSRGRGLLRVPASTAQGHEALLFGALARMSNEPTVDLAPVLREEGRRLARGTIAVVLSPQPGPGLTRELGVLRRRGIDVIELSALDARIWEVGAS